MTTLEKLTLEAETIMQIVRGGGSLTSEQLKTLQIYNQWKGGKAFNAGTRKTPKGENKAQGIS